MPSETFFKLPEDKKNKILQAAQTEFSRVSFEEASIKNIVNNARNCKRKFLSIFSRQRRFIIIYCKKTYRKNEQHN